MATDPIILGAEARAVLEALHMRNDVVVRFKTNKSGFDEDALDESEVESEGYYRADKRSMVLNLDSLTKGSRRPEHLNNLEDFRKFPVLAGAAAHKSGNARWSLWGTSLGDPFPETIPNPGYDPDDTATHTRSKVSMENQQKLNSDGTPALDADGDPIFELVEVINQVPVPKEFPVSRDGMLVQVANDLEEARVERLGGSLAGGFSKTWRKALTYSAGHFILEKIEADDQSDTTPLDAAVGLVIQVAGRMVAGSLGSTYDSRATCKKVLDSAQAIIEKALESNPDAIKDPFHAIMGIVSNAVMDNNHTAAEPHLEYARQILEIVYPEDKDNPDNSGNGSGGGSSAGGEGEGEEGGGGLSPEQLETLKEMAEAMNSMVQDEMPDPTEVDWEAPPDGGGGGHGSTLYKNPEAPQIDHYESPNSSDRELYRRAVAWMEHQVEPTVTVDEAGQWLPGGGSRLNVRAFVRDNLAGHRATQRTDWDKEVYKTDPAPPVKVGIMLDGSGSMHAYARPSASIAWAAANAAAALPEARTASVVYGNAAQVTQVPGHDAPRDVAVSRTDGGTEAFIEAAAMIEETLWLDEPIEDGKPSNVLIVIVSDLQYGGIGPGRESQAEGFQRITKDWKERGFQVVVVGAESYKRSLRGVEGYVDSVEIVSPADLFAL